MRNIKIKTVYKHFKGNFYLVEDLATDSESNKIMVVYRALYGDKKLYVRDIDMFLSEVDKLKYPDCSQKYRFEEQIYEEILKIK